LTEASKKKVFPEQCCAVQIWTGRISGGLGFMVTPVGPPIIEYSGCGTALVVLEAVLKRHHL
jgi:hypothetical protein